MTLAFPDVLSISTLSSQGYPHLESCVSQPDGIQGVRATIPVLGESGSALQGLVVLEEEGDGGIQPVSLVFSQDIAGVCK